MAEYSYNLGINHKNNTLTIDLKKIKEPTYIKMVNDMTKQVYIDRYKNKLVLTMAATKTSQTSDYRIFYKYESYNTFFNPPQKYVKWLEYYYDEYESNEWVWQYYSQGENGMKNVIAETVSEQEVKPDAITFYVYDKNFNLITSSTYECKRPDLEDEVVEAHTPEMAEYTKGTAVIDYGSNRNLGKIIIKNANYFDDSNPVYLSYKDNGYIDRNLITQTYNVAGKGKKKNSFSGTMFNENFDGSNTSDKIYTGSGNDTIQGNKGKDKIYISGKGDKTINIAHGDGNDTIYNSHKATSVTLNLDGFDYNNLYYTKRGNSLYVSRSYSDDDIETTKLNNFFKNKPANVYLAGDDKDILSRLNDSDIKLSLTSTSKTIKGTSYADEIYSGKKTKTVNAYGGNNLIVTNSNNKYKMNLSAGKGDDIYYLRNIDKQITISDKGNTTTEAGGDMLVIADSDYSVDNMFQFYNIKLNQNGGYSTDTSLHILSKEKNTGAAIKARRGKLSENIVIKNALNTDSSGGSGWIEKIGFYNNNVATAFNTDYVALEQEVSGWLANNNYTSSMDAFKRADSATVQELINIYTANT